MRHMNVTTESRVSDDAGNTVVVWRMDTRAPEDRVSVATLVKCGREEHAMCNLRTIRVSKLARFRSYGEGLVRDAAEGAASTTVITDQRIDDPRDLREDQEFYDEVGKCAESIGESMRMTVKSTKTTTERGTRFCLAETAGFTAPHWNRRPTRNGIACGFTRTRIPPRGLHLQAQPVCLVFRPHGCGPIGSARRGPNINRLLRG